MVITKERRAANTALAVISRYFRFKKANYIIVTILKDLEPCYKIHIFRKFIAHVAYQSYLTDLWMGKIHHTTNPIVVSGHNLVTIWSQSGHNLITIWSQFDHNLVTIWSHFGLIFSAGNDLHGCYVRTLRTFQS